MALNRKMHRPNRDKASSKLTRLVIILGLFLTAALVALISLLGWEHSDNLRNGQILFIIVCLVIAGGVALWSSGILIPGIANSLFILVFAALTYTSWWERDYTGYLGRDDASMMGWLVFLLIPLQIVLIGFMIAGSTQRWNTEKPAHIHGTHDRPDESVDAFA